MTDIRKMAETWGDKMIGDCMNFAIQKKTRRVYVLHYIVDDMKHFRVDYFWRNHSFEDRSFAYYGLRHIKEFVPNALSANVYIVDFKKIIELERPEAECFSFELRQPYQLVMNLWETFNTCVKCNRDSCRCEEVWWMGKRERMCIDCIYEIGSKLGFRVGKPKPNHTR